MEEKSLELKRVVMVKAIVTEAFKQNLVKELERAFGNLDAQVYLGVKYNHGVRGEAVKEDEENYGSLA